MCKIGILLEYKLAHSIHIRYQYYKIKGPSFSSTLCEASRTQLIHFPYTRPNKEIVAFLKLLTPTGHVMHQQFNIQHLYALPTLYLCVLFLSENKQRLVPQQKLIGFYNRDEKCLLRSTNCVFK